MFWERGVVILYSFLKQHRPCDCRFYIPAWGLFSKISKELPFWKTGGHFAIAMDEHKRFLAIDRLRVEL